MRLTIRDRAHYRLRHTISDHFWHLESCPRFRSGGWAKERCNCGRDAILTELWKAFPERDGATNAIIDEKLKKRTEEGPSDA